MNRRGDDRDEMMHGDAVGASYWLYSVPEECTQRINASPMTSQLHISTTQPPPPPPAPAIIIVQRSESSEVGVSREESREDEVLHDSQLVGKKKKKKKKLFDEPDILPFGVQKSSSEENATISLEPLYSYHELLSRVYSMMQHQPVGGPARLLIPPPSIARTGKRTMWFNFGHVAKILNRSVEHLSSFTLAELASPGSLDGNDEHLLIKGKYQPKQLESILRRYVGMYVSCANCKSLATHLEKDQRLLFLKCTACNSRYTVEPIKKGFRAQTSRRIAS